MPNQHIIAKVKIDSIKYKWDISKGFVMSKLNFLKKVADGVRVSINVS